MARQTGKENTKIRIIAIYRMLLQAPGIITTKAIQRKLRAVYGIWAERKTIYSDMAAINRIIPVKAIPGKNVGYCLWDVLGECEDG